MGADHELSFVAELVEVTNSGDNMRKRVSSSVFVSSLAAELLIRWQIAPFLPVFYSLK